MSAKEGAEPHRGLWVFFVLAMLPILLAVLVPAAPELLARLETVKVGGFEARLSVERLAASPGSYAMASERSNDESFFAVVAWRYFGDSLAQHRIVARWTEEDQLSALEQHDNFKIHFDETVRPLAGVIECQSVAMIGAQYIAQIVEDFIVILSPTSGFMTSDPAVGDDAERSPSGRLVMLDKTKKSVESLWEAINISLRAAPRFPEACRKSDFEALHATIDRIRQATILGPPRRFTSGYLSVFVAALTASQGGAGDTGLVRAIRYLDQSSRSAKQFTRMERFNLYRTMGRMMYRARWDIEDVMACFRLALNESKTLKSKISMIKNGKHPRTSKRLNDDEISDDEAATINEFDQYLYERVDLLILTDMLMAVNQYQIEGYFVSNTMTVDAERWRGEIATRTANWQPNHRRDTNVTDVTDKILANATVAVALFDVISLSAAGGLTAPVCSNAISAISEAGDFWRAFEVEAREDSENSQIGLFQGPIVLTQRYQGYVSSICRDASP
jgi:hypothetical protein